MEPESPLPDQCRAELSATGVATIHGIDRSAADAMAERIWEVMATYGVRRDDQSTWHLPISARRALRKHDVFSTFDNDTTRGLVDALLGPGKWTDNGNRGPALIAFPQAGPWTLSHRQWHLDLPGRGHPDQPGVARLFGFVTDVEPRGGGTLVVEGSHELVRRIVASSPGHDAGKSRDMRKRLAQSHPWFAALQREGGERIRRFMVDGEEIDGVRVRVRELTGRAGDVATMLPWTMHNLSMNCRPVPRFVVTHSIHRRNQQYFVPTNP